MVSAGPSTTTLLLVRHGATPSTGKVLPGRAPGLHLSPRGRAQAERLAERLASLGRPLALYSSPLERARETLAPVAATLGSPVKVERGLTECDFGAWTGQSLARLRRRAEWSQVQTSPSTFTFPEGESFSAMGQRMWATLGRLAERHRGEVVVAASHADPIKAAVTQALGVPLDLFQRTVISPCSVSAIMLGSGAPLVLCVNAVGALDELVPS